MDYTMLQRMMQDVRNFGEYDGEAIREAVGQIVAGLRTERFVDVQPGEVEGTTRRRGAWYLRWWPRLGSRSEQRMSDLQEIIERAIIMYCVDPDEIGRRLTEAIEGMVEHVGMGDVYMMEDCLQKLGFTKQIELTTKDGGLHHDQWGRNDMRIMFAWTSGGGIVGVTPMDGTMDISRKGDSTTRDAHTIVSELIERFDKPAESDDE